MVSLPLSALGLLLGLISGIIALTRRGHSIGFPIAGVALNGMALLLGIVWLGLLGAVTRFGNEPTKNLNVSNQTADTGSKDKSGKGGSGKKEDGTAKNVLKDEDWIDAQKNVARQGDIVVQIMSLAVDYVDLDKLGTPTKSKDKALQIRLTIESKSDAKEVEYSGWGNTEERPTLKDNFNNSHHRVRWAFGLKVKDQVRVTSIYPNKTIMDVLVFDVPVDKAQYLRLELPASAFGGTGSSGSTSRER